MIAINSYLKNLMKRKVVFCFILVFLFFNCKTTDETYTTYDVSDYTEEDLIAEKIDEVKALIETDSIKALFLSWELNANVKDNSELNELFNSCKENVYDLYKKFYEEEKYLDCKRCIQSLESVGYKFENIDEINKNLSQKIYSNVPGLNNSVNKKASREVSDWIKGCVTIYVDKGIKVENGKGFVDAVIGSGFFISADGYIVTNYHVISDIVDKKNKEFSRLYIKLYYDSENRVPAKVIGWDSNLDLALIKTEAEVPYYFSLGSSTELKVGDKVYVIGSPLGLEKTLTSGIISSKERNLFSLGSVFQLDAAVNSGNSGGPVLDSNGKVQAVVFAGVPYYQGLNFEIPVEYMKSILPYLIQGDENKHPWICAYGKTLKNVVTSQEGLGVKLYYVLSKINNNPLSL